jgi:hypothetical protein
MAQIDNGNGTTANINDKRELKVFSVQESESQAAVEVGDAYNINTGDIGCAGDTTLLYFKNDEDYPVFIEAFAVGIKGSTITDQATVTWINNPTGGDLITDATAVSMNQNRLVGSSKSLKSTTFAYKGKVSGTITGGSDAAQFYMGNNSRLFATINFEIERGSSIAIKLTDTTTGGNAYAALILHTKDSARIAS